MFYSKNTNPAFNKNMRRDLISKQVLKLCFACKRPFNKRKGRAKSLQVVDLIGRFVCESCVNKRTNAEASSATSHDGLDGKGTSRH